jgi:hypothetical protein
LVPCSKYSRTEESPRTDFERTVVTNGMPLRAFSIGTVTRLSTSSVEIPGTSV